jgi:hypothetical protein
MELDENIEHGYDGIISCSGATISISLILLSSWLTSYLPQGILFSISLFFLLPFVFNFIFGIAYNKPNFSTFRKYGFTFYLILAMGIFFYFEKPDSVTSSFMLFLQFIIGFVISFLSGILYLAPYTLLKRYSYRLKALVSFIISFALTYCIIFALKYWNLLLIFN